MAQLAMISNMVAELQGPEGLGAMMLPQAMTAVFYALAAALIYTAWTFARIGYLGHDTLFPCKKTKEVESEV